MDNACMEEIHGHPRSWPGNGAGRHLGHVITDHKELKYCTGRLGGGMVRKGLHRTGDLRRALKDQAVWIHLVGQM